MKWGKNKAKMEKNGKNREKKWKNFESFGCRTQFRWLNFRFQPLHAFDFERVPLMTLIDVNLSVVTTQTNHLYLFNVIFFYRFSTFQWIGIIVRIGLCFWFDWIRCGHSSPIDWNQIFIVNWRQSYHLFVDYSFMHNKWISMRGYLLFRYLPFLLSVTVCYILFWPIIYK